MHFFMSVLSAVSLFKLLSDDQGTQTHIINTSVKVYKRTKVLFDLRETVMSKLHHQSMAQCLT